MNETLAVVLEKPGRLSVRRIPVPAIGGPAVRVTLGACGICGSDIRYFQGENPWSLHTLGRHVPSPPNLVLGHEVAGLVQEQERRVAVLAYRACGNCEYCRSGRENLCEAMEHFGHGAGWPEMPYYPGGMAEQFDIWKDFVYDLPPSISFEEATFLDGLAVAVHAVDSSGLKPGQRFGVIGLGPIGMLAAQVAAARQASLVVGCDTSAVAVDLARRVGLEEALQKPSGGLRRHLQERNTRLDSVVDTVGSAESLHDGLAILDKSGSLVLLAVHAEQMPVAPIWFSGERRILSSSNNRYRDFPRAIELLASGAVVVKPLITHRFPLRQAPEAFRVALNKERERAYKVILHP
jgi:L-iditol 2-dehydrogenase